MKEFRRKKMLNGPRLAGFGLGLLAVLALAFPTFAQEPTPSVTVSDQPLLDGTVTVEKVVSVGPGWIVIHAQADGKPGPILGYSQVADGESNSVVVEVDASGATSTLYAMLHTDAGEIGTWEFPGGPDTPVMVGEQVVTPAFRVTAGLPATLPETGGMPASWLLLLLAAGGLLMGGGLVLRLRTP